MKRIDERRRASRTSGFSGRIEGLIGATCGFRGLRVPVNSSGRGGLAVNRFRSRCHANDSGRAPAEFAIRRGHFAARRSAARCRSQTCSRHRRFERWHARPGGSVVAPRGAPRGTDIDLWLKNVAPSTDLRRWYGHDPRKWTTFIEKYRAELHRHEDLLHLLGDLRTRGRLTLLCDARDTSHSHGVVLREVLTERRFLRQIPKGVTS